MNILDEIIKDLTKKHLEANDKNGKLYKHIVNQVEKPLFEAIMKHTHYNQVQSAKILGLSRGNFRQRAYNFDLITSGKMVRKEID